MNHPIHIHNEALYKYYCVINLYLETQSKYSSITAFTQENDLNLNKFRNMFYLIHKITLQEDYAKNVNMVSEFSPAHSNLRDFCREKNIQYNRTSHILRHIKYLEIIKEMKLKESSIENKSPISNTSKTIKTMKPLEFIAVKNVPAPSAPSASLQEIPTTPIFTDITINEIKFQLPYDFSAERITKLIQFIKDL